MHKCSHIHAHTHFHLHMHTRTQAVKEKAGKRILMLSLSRRAGSLKVRAERRISIPAVRVCTCVHMCVFVSVCVCVRALNLLIRKKFPEEKHVTATRR